MAENVKNRARKSGERSEPVFLARFLTFSADALAVVISCVVFMLAERASLTTADKPTGYDNLRA